MKAIIVVAVVIVLALIGISVADYSYTHLQEEDVIFNENSLQVDGQSYGTWQANIIPGNVFSIFSVQIVGNVSSVGTGVDFYLVNETNYPSWTTNIGQRSAFSVVHLNSDALSSQSAQERFSFTPSSFDSYIVVLVNDGYPNANGASVNVSLALRYTNEFSFGGFIAGLAMLSIALVTAMVRVIVSKRTYARETAKREPTHLKGGGSGILGFHVALSFLRNIAKR
jgi:hypothetical protein